MEVTFDQQNNVNCILVLLCLCACPCYGETWQNLHYVTVVQNICMLTT